MPAARRSVRTFVRSHGYSPDVEHRALALTGELVSDAVTHAGTSVGLRTRSVGDRLRVEVSNGSPVVVPLAKELATAQANFRMLDDLAADWDVRRHADRKTVWFEIDLRDG